MQLPISIDVGSGQTLQAQLIEQLRTLIRTRCLLPGASLPASRDLARQVGISRNTVTGAYETLIAEGYLRTEKAVGTFVAELLPDDAIGHPTTPPALESRSGSLYRALNLPLPYAGRGPSGLYQQTPRQIDIDFVFGRNSPRAFPERVWRRIVTDCLGGAAERFAEYGDPAGLPALREQVASSLGPARGMVLAADQVIVVAGFQQGINLAAHLFVGTNTGIAMEAPTYRGAAFLFESYGGKVIPVPVDRHGLDVSRMPTQRVKLVYVTPSHQFPTGTTMPLERRLELLDWAARAGAYILEVDYDADFRYDGSPLPSLQSLDRHGCVIYLNSFSRSLGPGMRIGYAVVPRDLIQPAVTIKSLMDNGFPWLEQAALTQFLREGAYETHVKRIRQMYGLRRDALLGALQEHLPEAAISGQDAGTHVCLQFPDDAPTAAEWRAAGAAVGIGLHPLEGSACSHYEHLPGFERTVLMGYAHLDETQIRDGVARLAQAVPAENRTGTMTFMRLGTASRQPRMLSSGRPKPAAGRSSPHTSRTLTVRGACPQDCPDTCALLYHVEDRKLVEVTGDADHPMTRGGLCVKLKNFAEHHYNPDRLLYPMKRVGPKGSGQFARISWDEALATIKTNWDQIIATHGAQAIMPHAYMGHQGTINGLTAGDAFFNRLGSTVAEKTYCESGSSTAWIMTVGPTGGLDLESLAYAKYIIVWGMNMLNTNMHAWKFILDAKAQGATIVVIDPVRTRTAKQADWHIRIRPGTDGALALGMMNVIIAEDLVDHDYVEKYTLGYEQLKARAAEFPPERVAEITGIPVEDILKLSRAYATTQPSAIRQGVAVERSPGGGDALRAITCLPALVGAWRHVGGGAVEMPIWEFPTDFGFLCRPDWIKPGTRVVNELELGAALTGEMPLNPPIQSLFVYNSNPVSQAPDAGTLVKGLLREDLFTVVSELFLTDTAKYADLLLPATMQAEQLDLMISWGHLYLMLNQPAIEPPGECVPNAELFRRLAHTMGFDDEQFRMSDETMLRRAYDWNDPRMAGITYDKLKEVGYMRLNVGAPHERAPHAHGDFKTPSGKCEFAASAASRGNFVVSFWRSGYERMQPGTPVEAVPDYIPPHESADDQLARRYPFSLMSPKPHAFLNTQYGNETLQQRRQGEQIIVIHPMDALPRNIENGTYVRVFNARGTFEARAELSEDVCPGLMMTNVGHWPGLNRSGMAVNSTTARRHANLGQAGVYSDNRVDVERA
ncbi:MocR-like pyridoxine biosynthesis transcription factor PdxR [Azohydromonas lata]|uniref:Aminotransferase class I/II-fold pyridoxal phosphate-dependent enzyme n=1 Tax=Azohydromonas lata TaxID=45677 RepID=A0ABU5INY8_9BURK|nr:aminotransferase class I/II-fold pyridoxal phosphate-dependent enzyme [Azohydromonas lata]MDZ5460591.1 aminotransferase class I/II-fold pyridoxal phosphate-dependent enzyme [Azohydromonas lata]